MKPGLTTSPRASTTFRPRVSLIAAILPANTHRPHSVQPTLRVDQPAVINRDIVGLRRLPQATSNSRPRNERSGSQV